MKYNCNLIRDITPLYKDGVLHEESRKIVNEHLNECQQCRNYYESYSESDFVNTANMSEKNDADSITQKAVKLSGKVKKYHFYQIGVFAGFVITMLTMCLTWYGHIGITEIRGYTVLGNPPAIIGIVLFIFAVWYNFHDIRRRIITGYFGIGLMLIMEIYDFLTIPAGSTTGIQIGPLDFSVPLFSYISIKESMQFALPGFYIGVATTVFTGVLFYMFTRKIKAMYHN